MSRKLIFGIGLAVLMCVMLAAPMHEAFEQHHTPFLVDGDFGAMTVTMFVGMCTGMAALSVPWLALLFVLVSLTELPLHSEASGLRPLSNPSTLSCFPPGQPFSLRI